MGAGQQIVFSANSPGLQSRPIKQSLPGPHPQDIRRRNYLPSCPGKQHLSGRRVGSFSEDRPLGWDPAAVGSRAGDGMARFVSEEKAAGTLASVIMI